MKHSNRVIALTLAAALTLTGCGGGSAEEDAIQEWAEAAREAQAAGPDPDQVDTGRRR